MAEETEKVTALRYTDTDIQEIEESVVKEYPFTISVNNQELVTLLCSPTYLKFLAVGFLVSEGVVKTKEDLKKVVVDERLGIAWVQTRDEEAVQPLMLSKRMITSGCGRGASFYNADDAQAATRIESGLKVKPENIFALVQEFQHYSEVYKTTHGVHSAALCDSERILLFRDDIGRHNAIDKIIGECLLNDIDTEDRMIVVSGRISSEMAVKVAKRGIPVLISISAPTNLGVSLANQFGLTLVGFVRPKRMNVYAGSERIAGS